MEFCPTCGNLLRYGNSQFFCSTCPYIARIERQVEIKKKQLLVKKSIDPRHAQDAGTTRRTSKQCRFVQRMSQNRDFIDVSSASKLGARNDLRL
ncbi:unnamed protein product [Eruca vesicaria subsp. sativa]|uniref:DNA-directed RNA polymerase II subunit RPB9-like zinc ribbon domain-containing protein n=1 Tax=Eruca vesicaria subsp. sativa TaxID=29727 RepID=A0ABC8JCX3_ERUVS|nr:unnamed protein product [Eruca vesicaria subsp. sativa]